MSKPSLSRIQTLLSKPTWSVRSLLPSATPSPEETINPSQLQHFLRLSALPIPSSPTTTASITKTLSAQLHFVRAIQSVDTTSVAPLRAIRDETNAGLEEARARAEERIEKALEQEETWGRWKRPKRRRDAKVDTSGVEDWDVLGNAEQKVGRYFVVRSGKEKKEKEEVA